jgi:3-hydroxy-9,10-secoandrosta-1,3,5(10)-triene-9,17-dione monooxygenase reductase component
MTTLSEVCSDQAAPATSTATSPDLRQAMRRYVTGVTVVTALTDDGRLAGMTANSFTSVSLDPPLVLFCLDHSARSCGPFLRAGRIAIHMLADDQDEIARAFARRGGDRGAICPWHINARGFAILDHSFAVLECRIVDVHNAGDHAIVVARVQTLDGPGAGQSPLVFHDGKMFGLGAAGA